MQKGSEKLDTAGYRKFGFTTGAIVVLLFGLLLPWLLGFGYPRWPWLVGAVLMLWALLAPASLRPVHLGWMKFGTVMNWINTRLILGILFYGLFVPIGLVMRLFGRDTMHRKLDRRLASYRIESHDEPRDNVERPF